MQTTAPALTWLRGQTWGPAQRPSRTSNSGVCFCFTVARLGQLRISCNKDFPRPGRPNRASWRPRAALSPPNPLPSRCFSPCSEYTCQSLGGGFGVALGSPEGGFRLAIGCLLLAYQMALGRLWDGFEWLALFRTPPGWYAARAGIPCKIPPMRARIRPEARLSVVQPTSPLPSALQGEVDA